MISLWVFRSIMGCMWGQAVSCVFAHSEWELCFKGNNHQSQKWFFSLSSFCFHGKLNSLRADVVEGSCVCVCVFHYNWRKCSCYSYHEFLLGCNSAAVSQISADYIVFDYNAKSAKHNVIWKRKAFVSWWICRQLLPQSTALLRFTEWFSTHCLSVQPRLCCLGSLSHIALIYCCNAMKMCK